MIPGASGPPQRTGLEHTLDQLEQAKRDGSEVTYCLRKGTGTVEVKVSKHWSPFRWLESRRAKRVLTKQVKNNLNNPLIKKSLKDRLVRDIGNRTLPHLSVENVKDAVYSRPNNLNVSGSQIQLQNFLNKAKNNNPHEINLEAFHKHYATIVLHAPELLETDPRLRQIKPVLEALPKDASYNENNAISEGLANISHSGRNFIFADAIKHPDSIRGRTVLDALGLKASDLDQKKSHEQVLLMSAKLDLNIACGKIRNNVQSFGIADVRDYFDACFYLSLQSINVGDAVELEDDIERHFNWNREHNLLHQERAIASLKAIHNIRDGSSREEAQVILKRSYDKPDSPSGIILNRAFELIEHNLEAPRSRTGDRWDKVSRADLDLMTLVDGKSHKDLILNKLTELNSAVREFTKRSDVKKINEFFESCDLQVLIDSVLEYHSDFDSLSEKKKKQVEASLPAIAIARKLLFEIESGLGSEWEADALSDPKLVGEKYSKLYGKLQCIRAARGSEIDIAQLQWMKEQNHNAVRHPRTVIEGGGPNGLLAAIKLYIQGADVTVVERRGTDYQRSQILRLDSRWLKELEFVLGEKFHYLFDPEWGAGKLLDDGSGHISTFELEQVLHRRFSELLSLEDSVGSGSSDSRAPQKLHLKRHAAFSIEDVSAPAEANGPYLVQATYQERFDRQKGRESDINTPQDSRLQIEADILLCAGGQGSPTRDQFFGYIPKTSEAEYGVCSWKGGEIEEKNPHLDAFSDFRDVITFKPDFISVYKDKLAKQFRTPAEGTSVSERCKELAVSLLDQKDNALLDAFNFDIYGKTVRLRTFENRGLVYLGMEIPGRVKKWFDDVGRYASDNNLSREDQLTVQRVVKEAWFQTVADYKGFGEALGATADEIDHNFVATFPVEQSAVYKKYEVVDSADSKLIVLPVGDAACSPHFMTYSGLTGGREYIGIVEDFMKEFINSPDSRDDHLKQLSDRYEDNADHILHRGQDFLKSQGDTFRLLQQKQLSHMEKLRDASAKAQWTKPYTVHYGQHKGEFKVQVNKGGTFVLGIARNGELEIHKEESDDIELYLGSFSSFKKFELESRIYETGEQTDGLVSSPTLKQRI